MNRRREEDLRREVDLRRGVNRKRGVDPRRGVNRKREVNHSLQSRRPRQPSPHQTIRRPDWRSTGSPCSTWDTTSRGTTLYGSTCPADQTPAVRGRVWKEWPLVRRVSGRAASGSGALRRRTWVSSGQSSSSSCSAPASTRGRRPFGFATHGASSGRLGAGQTWSPFMDPDVFPNSIEYWGPNGMVFFRNVQFRWMPWSDGDSNFMDRARAARSERRSRRLRRPHRAGERPGPFSGSRHFEPLSATHDDWGHVQLAGIVRYINVG